MLEGLDAIPWSSLTHAYGAARDVPELIGALASPDADARTRALNLLHGNIGHQGTVYEATAHAVPFLLDLAREPAVPEREEILALLADLAAGASYADAHVHMRGRPDFEERRARELGWVASAHEAVKRGLDLVRGFLSGPDPLLRAGAAHLLAAFPELADELEPAMLFAARVEREPLIRAGLLLALGELGRASGTRSASSGRWADRGVAEVTVRNRAS